MPISCVLVGASGSGKTGLFQSLTNGGSTHTTVTCACHVKPIQNSGGALLWDTPGAERSRPGAPAAPSRPLDPAEAVEPGTPGPSGGGGAGEDRLDSSFQAAGRGTHRYELQWPTGEPCIYSYVL